MKDARSFRGSPINKCHLINMRISRYNKTNTSVQVFFGLGSKATKETSHLARFYQTNETNETQMSQEFWCWSPREIVHTSQIGCFETNDKSHFSTGSQEGSRVLTHTTHSSPQANQAQKILCKAEASSLLYRKDPKNMVCFHVFSIIYTPRKTNMKPENHPPLKWRIIFQILKFVGFKMVHSLKLT